MGKFKSTRVAYDPREVDVIAEHIEKDIPGGAEALSKMTGVSHLISEIISMYYNVAIKHGHQPLSASAAMESLNRRGFTKLGDTGKKKLRDVLEGEDADIVLTSRTDPKIKELAEKMAQDHKKGQPSLRDQLGMEDDKTS